MDYYFQRTIGGLAPCDSAAEAAVAAIKVGHLVRCTIKRDRHPEHHAKFFAIINMVFKNQETYLSAEGLRFAIMIAAGYVDEIRVGDKVHMKPKSLSWGTMDQAEFELFYAAALGAIPRLLPQFKGVDLEKERVMSSTQL